MKFSGASGQSSANTVNAGQWYVIDLRVRTGANPHTIDWQVDGVAQTQSTNAVAADTLSNIRFGGSITAEVFTAYFDDMIYTTDGSDYPIGAGGIHGLVPNVTSTVSDASGFIDADDGSAITTADSS
jgi:hypothetical protein